MFLQSNEDKQAFSSIHSHHFLSTLLQQPFKASCCIQNDYYSLDQKQNLCKKLGCDYNDCDTYESYDDSHDDSYDDLHDDSYDNSHDDSYSWGSGSEPTDAPTWNSDGHDPTYMPTWETDAWKDEDKCSGVSFVFV